MGWTHTPNEAYDGPNKQFVTINRDNFLFNSGFGRQAELEPSKRVTIFIDSEEYKIGFEFHAEERPGSYGLTRATVDRTKSKTGSVQCWAQKLILGRSWIRRVSDLPTKDRRFRPTREGKLWVIRVCPAFELKTLRASADIPSDAVGIYRYVRSNGEVVYIGRGTIKERLSSLERENWEFDLVEYSIVRNLDQQIEWEAYWIKRFQEENKGRLPIFNRISGAARD